MMKGLNRSVTGLVLATLLGTTNVLPSFAQEPIAATTNATQETSPQPGDIYTLGAGDLIRIDSFDTPELVLESRYTVLFDGSINLPWIGGLSVQGLTLKQAADALAKRYSKFINNPTITVSLVAPRPLRIGIIGEINRPGSYIISVIGSESTQASLSQRTGSESGSQWPTVSKAIQTAGGITQIANIRQIQIERLQNGTKQVIDVNLWKFLDAGDLTQDILLKDGDTIKVPIATNLDATEATLIAGSNFSPEFIKVNVVGEVSNPGSVSIRPNSTLNQAVLAAGGMKPGRAKRKVELIRLNPNGTVSRRTISIDLSQT